MKILDTLPKSRFEVLYFLSVVVIDLHSSSTSDSFHLRPAVNTSPSPGISGSKSLSTMNRMNELHNNEPQPPLTH